MTPTFTQASQKASKKGEPFTAHTSSTRAPRDHHNRQMKPFELSLPRPSSSQIMNDNNACRSKLLHKIMATHNDFKLWTMGRSWDIQTPRYILGWGVRYRLVRLKSWGEVTLNAETAFRCNLEVSLFDSAICFETFSTFGELQDNCI